MVPLSNKQKNPPWKLSTQINASITTLRFSYSFFISIRKADNCNYFPLETSAVSSSDELQKQKFLRLVRSEELTLNTRHEHDLFHKHIYLKGGKESSSTTKGNQFNILSISWTQNPPHWGYPLEQLLRWAEWKSFFLLPGIKQYTDFSE